MDESTTDYLEKSLANRQDSLEAWNRTIEERTESLNGAVRMKYLTEIKITRLKMELVKRTDKTVKITHTRISQGMGNAGCKYCIADVMDYGSNEAFDEGECPMTYVVGK